MIIYMKHPTLGNEHCDESEQAARELAGWVRWPRSPEQKARDALKLAAPPAAVAVVSPAVDAAEPIGAAPVKAIAKDDGPFPIKRGPGRPRKVA
jgi:hypothetical protein